MYYKWLLILMLLTSVGDQFKNEEVIAWNPSAKLEWTNFQGRPKNLDDVVALTSSGISFEFSIKEENRKVISFDTGINAHFYPKYSWFHPKLASDYILAHEQMHFDITELHARMFRKKVSQLVVSNHINKDLDKTYLGINKDLEIMQKAYDQETNHSRDTLAQLAWNQKIETALTAHKAYKNP